MVATTPHDPTWLWLMTYPASFHKQNQWGRQQGISQVPQISLSYPCILPHPLCLAPCQLPTHPCTTSPILLYSLYASSATCVPSLILAELTPYFSPLLVLLPWALCSCHTFPAHMHSCAPILCPAILAAHLLNHLCTLLHVAVATPSSKLICAHVSMTTHVPPPSLSHPAAATSVTASLACKLPQICRMLCPLTLVVGSQGEVARTCLLNNPWPLFNDSKGDYRCFQSPLLLQLKDYL